MLAKCALTLPQFRTLERMDERASRMEERRRLLYHVGVEEEEDLDWLGRGLLRLPVLGEPGDSFNLYFGTICCFIFLVLFVVYGAPLVIMKEDTNGSLIPVPR